MPQSRSDTALVRMLIMQVLVQRGGDGVFDRRLHRVYSETCAQPLAVSSRSATPLRGAIAQVCDPGAGRHTCHRTLPECADRKSTRLNSSHSQISYAVFCLKKKKK